MSSGRNEHRGFIHCVVSVGAFSFSPFSPYDPASGRTHKHTSRMVAGRSGSLSGTSGWRHSIDY